MYSRASSTAKLGVNDGVRRAPVLACLASRRYGGLALVGLAGGGVDVVSASLTGSCHLKQLNVSTQCPVPGERKDSDRAQRTRMPGRAKDQGLFVQQYRGGGKLEGLVSTRAYRSRRGAGGTTVASRILQ
jgi:hypothetical protein